MGVVTGKKSEDQFSLINFAVYKFLHRESNENCVITYQTQEFDHATLLENNL